MPEKTKVLIADDNKSFCSQCAALLKTYGFEPVVAPKDGAVVTQMILEHQPDIVLMDVFMPRCDAIGVMKNVRASDIEPLPRFMIMSSFDNALLERELLSSGAAYYFLRPFDVEMLVERIVQISGLGDITAPQAIPLQGRAP